VDWPHWRRSLALCSPCFQHIRCRFWRPRRPAHSVSNTDCGRPLLGRRSCSACCFWLGMACVRRQNGGGLVSKSGGCISEPETQGSGPLPCMPKVADGLIKGGAGKPMRNVTRAERPNADF